MSNYPDAEDVFTPVTGSDEMSEHAERHTAEEEAIVAIQQTLGTNPEGTSDTVVDRLDAFDSHTHDEFLTDLPDHSHPDLEEKDAEEDARLDALEESQEEQNTRLDALEEGMGGGEDCILGHYIRNDFFYHNGGAQAQDYYLKLHKPSNNYGDEGTGGDLDDRDIEKNMSGIEVGDTVWLIVGDNVHEIVLDDKQNNLSYYYGYRFNTRVESLIPKDAEFFLQSAETCEGGDESDDHDHEDVNERLDALEAAEVGDHTHDPDDTKLDKGTTTYLDAKAIEDDIDGIEQSISNLSDNYDQIIIDLGETGKDITVELESYLKKGTASYADAKGIEDDIDQEKTDRAEGDTALSEEIAKKLDKGATTYADAKEIQDAIESIVVPDVGDFVTGDDLTTALSGKADEPHTHDELNDRLDALEESMGGDDDCILGRYKNTGNFYYNGGAQVQDYYLKLHKPTDKYGDEGTGGDLDNRDIDKNMSAIEVGDTIWLIVGDNVHEITLAAKQDLSSYYGYRFDERVESLVGKDAEFILQSAETCGEEVGDHTHDDLAAGDHDHSGVYAEEDHTHDEYLTDLTHDHSGTYQPVGDYATNTDLDTLKGRVSTNEGDLVTIKSEQITQNTDIKENADKNTEQDGKISALETANQSLENKVDALENAIIDAQYKISITPNPREGFVSVGNGSPSNVIMLTFNAKDANGTTHNFDQIKEEDIVTISTVTGVGSYTVASDPSAGFFSVAFISGNGTFVDADLADVVVQPAFDSSSFALKTYVDAQDELMYPKGVVPNGETRTYADAYLLEKAVLGNADAINNNADAIDNKADEDHTHDAPEINTSQVTLAADSIAGFHELEDGTEVITQSDVNVYLSENVVFKGTTWGDLAGRS